MALQTFTAGQVLTAAQVTALQANDYNQTVNNYTDSRTLTIADLGDRVVMNKATATTITVNTGIFAAGDTLWIHNIGAGVCTITAGTATVSTSGSLALAQNSGGTLYFTSTGVAIFFPTVAASAQGLTLLSTTSFSGVASISLPADTFTTTYDHYEVLLSVSNATSNETNLLMRLRAAGSDNTTANYGNFIDRYGLNAVSYPQSAATTTTFAVVGTISNLNRSGFTFKIMSPKLSQATSIHSQGISPTSGSYSGAFSHNGNAIFATTTSFDSATFYTSENITGTYSVYGYNK